MTQEQVDEPIRFRTIRDRILVMQDKAPAKFGSLHIPDSAQKPPNEGMVIASGRDRDVVVGERVLFIKNAGTVVKIQGREALMMSEVDIYGVLENGSLRPIGSKVLVVPDPIQEKIGRIELPKWVAKEARQREQLVGGTIAAIGPGMRTKAGGRWPMADVKVGQRVLYYQNYTPDLVINGTTYVVVSDDQLRAVIEE